VLREARLEDADELAALFLASRREALPYLPALHTDEETHQWMRDVVLATCQVWVVTEDERPTGFLALAGDEVEHLYVLPGCQGRGVGGSLLAVAKDASPDRLSLYTFQANTKARAFYERKGFRAIAFGDGSENEEAMPDILYEWVSGSR